jgi:hypothetical protein
VRPESFIWLATQFNIKSLFFNTSQIAGTFTYTRSSRVQLVRPSTLTLALERM